MNTTENKSNLLVSIVVITYNSEKYVIETLESIKVQSYGNIELIISDDSSKDNTVGLCREWISNNNNRFYRTKLVTMDNNTGIPANCKRGLKVAKGEWIKYLAGDDILLPTCISDNVIFAQQNPKAVFIYSDQITFGSDNNQNRLKIESYYRKRFENCNKNKQLKFYARHPVFINSPTWFIKRNVFLKVNAFNTNLRIMDDQDTVFRLLTNKIEVFKLNKTTVKYRLHESSVSRNPKNEKLIKSEKIAIFREFRSNHLSYFNFLDLLYIYDYFVNVKISNRSLRGIFQIINPLFIYQKIILKFG